MTQTKMLNGVKLESIFHPSDFSEASEVAFVHALKIALVAGAKLTMLHVEASPGAEWQDFPGVRDTLERWAARGLAEQELRAMRSRSRLEAAPARSEAAGAGNRSAKSVATVARARILVGNRERA